MNPAVGLELLSPLTAVRAVRPVPLRLHKAAGRIVRNDVAVIIRRRLALRAFEVEEDVARLLASRGVAVELVARVEVAAEARTHTVNTVPVVDGVISVTGEADKC